MEWKWVKTLLICFFFVLNIFLGYQVYERNTVSVINSKTVESLNSILSNQGIKCDFELTDIETRKYMKKINISNEKTIKEEFLPLRSVDETEVSYSGRNREIISIASLIASFIRETKLEDVVIENISLGYYPEISQIDKNILSGEATPAWSIEIKDGETYIYNAYLGTKITQKS